MRLPRARRTAATSPLFISYFRGLDMMYFVRVGIGGNVEQFKTIQAAAVYFNLLGVGRPWRWRGMGFDTPNYHGADYVHVRRGFNESITAADRTYLERTLEEAEL